MSAVLRVCHPLMQEICCCSCSTPPAATAATAAAAPHAERRQPPLWLVCMQAATDEQQAARCSWHLHLQQLLFRCTDTAAVSLSLPPSSQLALHILWVFPASPVKRISFVCFCVDSLETVADLPMPVSVRIYMPSAAHAYNVLGCTYTPQEQERV